MRAELKFYFATCVRDVYFFASLTAYDVALKHALVCPVIPACPRESAPAGGPADVTPLQKNISTVRVRSGTCRRVPRCPTAEIASFRDSLHFEIRNTEDIRLPCLVVDDVNKCKVQVRFYGHNAKEILLL
mmetsp:Transcript_15855/g.42819  ORF Transcript_15855/g.42819 Transcript_15855/m.42819 type:complete len:130 (+) Transcript_15855:43-432(+)